MTESPSTAPKYIDDGIFGRGAIRLWKTHGISARAGLVLALIAGSVIFGVGSRVFEVPPLPGFDGSLLRQASPVTSVIVVAVMMVVAALVGTVIAGAIRFEAGIFIAALGLSCISMRGGTIRSVLFEVNGSASVYITLIFELLILSVILLGLWSMLWLLGKKGFVHAAPEYVHIDESVTTEPPAPGGDLTGNIIALATQVAATAIILLFLCQSENKKQAIASVGIASVLGTTLTYMGFPTRPSIWFWTAPLIVGLFGYVLAAAGQNADLAIGHPSGAFAALARPLPLDYASVGPAGAILGYWMMRKNTPAHVPMEDAA